MENILSWVKSGLLFTILASVILLLSPDKSYRKHISLVIGLLFILVMIHPVMDVMNLDDKTYISYLENFLMLEGTQENMSDNHIAMYEESVALQLMAALNDGGYEVSDIVVKAKEDGNIREVQLTFEGVAENIETVESYLYNLFGEEVKVVYEFG